MDSLAQIKALAFDQLLAHLPAGIAILDRELRYQTINPQLAFFNGVSVEHHLGRTVQSVLPHLYPKIEGLLQKVLITGHAELDFAIGNAPDLRSGLPHFWRGSYIPLKNDQGDVEGILVVAVNETLEQIKQREQQEEVSRLRQVLNHLFAFAGILDPDGVLLDANNPPLEQAGLGLADVQQKYFWDCFWWSHDPAVAASIQQAVLAAKQGQTSRFDTTARMRNQVIDIDFMIAPMFDAQGQLQYLIPSGIEITSRKQSQRHLAESEQRFRQVFNSVADALIAVDERGIISLVNQRAKEMFGYSVDELIGQPVELLVSVPQAAQHQRLRQHFLQAPKSRQMAQRQELFAKRRNGELIPVEIGLTYMQDDPLVSVLATVTDVTMAKQIQQRLELAVEEQASLLAERTALLNEVHHRVKNNLQVISSLLNLQTRNAPESLRYALTECQLRVRSMALTHQLLYEHKDFSSVPFSTYLKQLCHLLSGSLFSSPHIRFDFSGLEDNLILSLDQTIPCGLLVNEIITNSLKHAFPNGQSGIIGISAKQDPVGFCRLRIGDNGIGLAPNITPGVGSTMGMQLIPAFVSQLNAEFQLERNHGTWFEFQFALA